MPETSTESRESVSLGRGTQADSWKVGTVKRSWGGEQCKGPEVKTFLACLGTGSMQLKQSEEEGEWEELEGRGDIPDGVGRPSGHGEGSGSYPVRWSQSPEQRRAVLSPGCTPGIPRGGRAMVGGAGQHWWDRSDFDPIPSLLPEDLRLLLSGPRVEWGLTDSQAVPHTGGERDQSCS